MVANSPRRTYGCRVMNRLNLADKVSLAVLVGIVLAILYLGK